MAQVVYRGYTTTEQLQRMHNDAIETRTQLRLRQDTEREVRCASSAHVTLGVCDWGWSLAFVVVLWNYNYSGATHQRHDPRQGDAAR